MFSALKDFFVKIKTHLFGIKVRPVVSHSYDIRLLQKVKGSFWPRFKQLKQLGRLLTSGEKKLFLFGLLMLFVGLFWVSTNWLRAHRLEAPAKGGIITEAEVGAPQFVNPIFAVSNDVDNDICRLVFSGLMRYDKKNNLVPDLAVNYTLSADKKVYTFNLRHDVVWHDGEDFTSRDVVFTFDTIQNVLVGSPLYVSFQGVKVEAPDDYTVVFTLSEPYSSFVNSLTVGILPEHVWFNVGAEQMRLAQTNIQPVGTGPFMFKKLTKDGSGRIYTYELSRFDRYYRQEAYLDGFTFQFYADYDGDGGAVQALRNQKVDSLNFVPKSLTDKVVRKYINLKTLQLSQYTALFFNQNENTALKDKNIRLALGEALDRERIIREAIHGEGQLINSPVLPGSPGYDAEIGKLDYNVAAANELLDKTWPKISVEEYKEIRRKELAASLPVAEASSTVATTTVALDTATATSSPEVQQQVEEALNQEINQAQSFYRKNKDGKVLEINLVTVGTDEYKQAAQIIAGLWQEVGVKTNITFVDSHDFSKEVLRNRNYDALLYGEIVGSDPDQYPFWHSSQVNFPGLNLAGYRNSAVDTLLQNARVATTLADKADLYKKFQTALVADYPAVFLYMPTYTYALNSSVKGMEVVRISNPADRFADITNWYVKTSGQWNF